MRAGHLRRAGALVAMTAVGATGFASVGASASDEKAAEKGTVATITIASEGKDLLFKGPRKINSGSKLKIVNETDPRMHGPHTFSLFEKKLVPKDKQEIKDCFKFEAEVCVDVAKAHKVNFKKETVGKVSVDVGKRGWDTAFGKKGDSWVALGEGDATKRKVTAKAGTTLSYVCVIHPFMQGKIKVVK